MVIVRRVWWIVGGPLAARRRPRESWRPRWRPPPLKPRYYGGRAYALGLVLLAALAVGSYLAPSRDRPWTHEEQRLHRAAAPNCDAARAVGLAPSVKGRPGYWPQHDRDGDGVSCEWWAGDGLLGWVIPVLVRLR
jgi:hypothetical protein